MKIRIDDINSKDNNLKTTENNLYEYNPKIKTVKKNSLKTIDRIKKNNLISISDAHMNKKNENIKQSNSNNKSINKPKISNKSNNKQKINKKKSITNKDYLMDYDEKTLEEEENAFLELEEQIKEKEKIKKKKEELLEQLRIKQEEKRR